MEEEIAKYGDRVDMNKTAKGKEKIKNLLKTIFE